MSLAQKLAEERRARLAAERLLELKQAELFAANRKLAHHAHMLSHEITETRAEVATVRHENVLVRTKLGEAFEKIEMVEGQLWKALRSIRDGFALFNSDGLLEIANPPYLSVFEGLDTIAPGTSYAHIVQMMIEEGIVDLQGVPAAVWRDRMLSRWEDVVIEPITLRLWSGDFFKIQDRRTPDGGIVSLAIDITELMRMWSAVEELPDGFVIYDSEDRLLMSNGPYRDMYAASAEVMIPGTPFEEILRFGLKNGQYQEAAGREEDWLEDRMEKHRSSSIEHEQQLKDGRWIRVYEKETSDGGRVGLRIDISQMKQVQRDLEEAKARAESANRAKSAFLANMSHEIRTPMNGVVGMADIMMDADLTAEQRLYVETIRNSGESLLSIINDVLDFSKIEADKLILHTEPFDLERAVHEVVMLLQPSARNKAVELLVDYDMFLPTRFVGDVGRLRQALTNLIGNAVKFTVKGHVLVRVVGLPGEDGNTAIHLTVEDTGIGSPADKVEHVFGEFNQVDDETNRLFEGTGLGLSITRKLIELMGGDVWVESELGKGSCFGFRVALPTDESSVIRMAQVPAGLKRVLVVADHSVTRSILGKQLSILGLEVSSCLTGRAALDQMGDPPDLLIAEQDLPDMEGTELAAQLRQKGRVLPVLLISRNPGALLDAPPRDDVAGYLHKPVSRSDLFAAIEGLNAPPAIAPPPPPPKAAALRTLRVLVAEDNRTNQLVFRKMVAALDLDLVFAKNGFEAVEAFRARRPDIIFMDISMPGMDGKQATREIRACEGEGPHVPIVAVTAHAMAGDREGILEAGLDDYLTKPLRKAELIAKFEAHVGAPADK
ncbi:MAG: response regulator [Rhodobacterales bacterium]